MSKKQTLQLYRSLVREAKKLPAYNFRNYALRRIRDSFHENRNLTDQNVINTQLELGAKNLEVIKRQVIIGQLYSTDKLVIEYVHPQN